MKTENKPAKKRKKVIHRVGTANSNRIIVRIKEVNQYVVDNLCMGAKLSAPRDAYNTDSDRRKVFSRRTVVGFYPYFILTVDDFGKRETYQYIEAFELMRKGGKKNNA